MRDEDESDRRQARSRRYRDCNELPVTSEPIDLMLAQLSPSVRADAGIAGEFDCASTLEEALW